jgi:hypothetical protein
MEYTIVKEQNHEELIRKVAELIRQGWKPLGGVSIGVVAPVLGVHIFCQAMTRDRS